MLQCVLVVLSLVLVAVQAVVLTIPDETLVNGIIAGTPFTISWADADGPVGLFLVNGTTNDIAAIVGFDVTGQTTYTWTPATTLPNAVYKFEIGDSTGAPAYSNLFNLTGGGVPTSTLSRTTFLTSISSTKLTESTKTSQSPHHTHSSTWSRTHTGPPSTRTHHLHSNCTSGSCSMASSTPSNLPPPLPRCSTTCMRNLNDTRVTHTADNRLPGSTSSVESAKDMTTSTQNVFLSPTAKVAIGVGAAVGLAIVAVLLVLVFWQGKRIGQESVEKAEDPRYVMHGAGVVVEEEKAPVELDASPAHNILEIDGRRREWEARGHG